MGIVKCNITVDNQWATYYPGQTINGQIEYTFDAPKKIRGITVKIRGEAEVLWSTTENRKNDQGNNVSHTVNHNANEEYFNISYYLIGGKGSEMEIPAGTHTYPFACALPPTLPSSFEGEHGHVRYTVKVTLDRPWKFDQETKMAFTVVAHMDLNVLAQAQAPTGMHLEKHFCCCWCKSGPLIIDVGLPVSGFCCGQTMPFDINVENGSNVDVNSITLIFRKVVTFRCHSPTSETKTSKVEIARIVTDPITAHNTVNWTKVMEIPPLPPSNLVNCGIIDLDYEIKVDVNNSGCHIDMDATSPVIIGTVPLVGYQSPPPEGHSVSVLPDIPPGKDQSNSPLMPDPSNGMNSGPPQPYPPSVGVSPYPAAPYPNSQPPYPDPQAPYPNPQAPYPNPQVPYPANPSAPPEIDQINSQNIYPALAHQPVFRQTQFGTSNIHDSGDNQHTMISGNTYFAPMYPTYGFQFPK